MATYQKHRGRSEGVAAIEFFLVLPLILLMLAFPLYLGRYCYYYSVAHSAAVNAAQYLSTIPLSDMTNLYRAPLVLGGAREIVMEMLWEPNSGSAPPLIMVNCVDHSCGGNVKPTLVRVGIEVTVADIFFPNLTQINLPVIVTVTLPYLGR